MLSHYISRSACLPYPHAGSSFCQSGRVSPLCSHTCASLMLAWPVFNGSQKKPFGIHQSTRNFLSFHVLWTCTDGGVRLGCSLMDRMPGGRLSSQANRQSSHTKMTDPHRQPCQPKPLLHLCFPTDIAEPETQLVRRPGSLKGSDRRLLCNIRVLDSGVHLCMIAGSECLVRTHLENGILACVM